MRVFILQGLPGSGKSTYVKSHMDAVMAANDGECDDVVVSADHFFMRNGEYVFDGTKLAAAHNACLLEYAETVRIELLRRRGVQVFVDNTNTHLEEVARYYALGLAYGWQVEILYFPCPVETALSRNIHNVPESTIREMAARLEKFESQMSPWWRRRTIDNKEVK